jgi:hypothetical protein
MGIEYPVVIDNDYAIWDAFANRYWPALYLADDAGRIRYHHFGEGGYEQTEQAIRQLLADSGAGPLPEPAAKVVPRGIEVAADWEQLKSPETYLGLRRSAGFASPQTPLLGRAVEYSLPQRLELNQWAQGGSWTIGQEAAVNNRTGGRLVHRFHARDLNLILSPPPGGSAGFRIGIDGKPPENDHGIDVDSKGDGVVDEVRLYQLIRQSGPINDRRFEIEFSDAGVGALCFTFG